jgi:hypothetical protein
MSDEGIPILALFFCIAIVVTCSISGYQICYTLAKAQYIKDYNKHAEECYHQGKMEAFREMGYGHRTP